MSIELAIQKFPKETNLKDGFKCKVRPLRKDDEKSFHEFFLSVPAEERMFIKHRVTQPEVIHDWCQNIDLGRNFPLLATVEGKIVGDVTLHQQYVADISEHARVALATVDPTPYFQKYGANVWAAVKGYLDGVANTAAAPVIEKYTGVLGAADVFTEHTTFWLMESIRLDLGVGSQVHP